MAASNGSALRRQARRSRIDSMNGTATASTDLYDDRLGVAQARDRYLERYGLGDGGYDADWTFTWFGPVPVVLPNFASRKRALRAHDLHHVATGCNAVWNQGELDVTAFELRGGGPGRLLLGWAIIVPLFALGLVLRPR